MAPRPPPIVIVCVGKPCRQARGHEKVLRLAAEQPPACTVACQGLCDGPVVGIRRRGRYRWYVRVRGDRRRALRRALVTGRGWRRLRPGEAHRRRGTIRRAGSLRPLTR